MKTTSLLLALGLSLSAAPALAEPDATHEALKGLNWRVTPGVFVPLDAGSAGFLLSDHIGYGIDLGKLIISPGLSVPFFFIENNFSLAVAGEVQAYMPLGPVAPYAQIAAGAFVPTNVGSAGFFFRGGAGIIWFANSYFGIGAELSYNRAGDANIFTIGFPVHLVLPL